MHHGMPGDAASVVMSVCLAALVAIGGVVVAIAFGVLRLPRLRPACVPLPTAAVVSTFVMSRSRAGPECVAVLCRSLR